MDSDRDSVLESEDGKEVIVRCFVFFSKSAVCFFLDCIGEENMFFII